MNQRHIVLLTPGFPPLPGGGERYVAALATELARRDYRVTVLTSGVRLERDFWQGAAGSPAESVANLAVERYPVAPFPGGRPGLLLWRKAMVLLSALPGDQTPWLRRLGRWVPRLTGLEAGLATLSPWVDMVHGFNLSWEAAILAGAACAQRRGYPWIVTPFAHFGPDPRGRVARNTMMDHQRALLRQADAVLALTAGELTGLAAWGVKPRQAVVVGGGVDALPPAGDPTATLNRLALTPPYALFIGRASYDKGALHAAQAALAEGYTLALVGQTTTEFDRFYGRLAPAQQRLIRPLGLLREEDKHALLSAASFLLLPSRVDSFGIVLLEAWQHGRPVIGAQAGGIAHVISHERDGLLVPFGDVVGLRAAIARLAQDEPWRRQLGAEGRRKVDTLFNWSAVTDRTVAVYETIWSGHLSDDR